MKSHEQELLSVCECIITDAFAKCYTDKVNMTRDLKTIRKRVTYEGISFLTITLPTYGQDFEKSLELGRLAPNSFLSFKKRRSLPAFLQGLMSLVFSVETGGLLDDPDLAAVEGIRQIAYTFKKLLLPCTSERINRALSGYEEVERELSTTMFIGDTDLFDKVSLLLWSNTFNESYDSEEYTPKHGPGQTAESISGNRKYSHNTWYERLEPFFPIDSYLYTNINQCFDEKDGLQALQLVPCEDELPVKVTCVPKTLKGPRIIAMEPVAMQYAQQALSSYICRKIETSYITSGHINFVNQSVNKKLAIKSSSTRDLATLDLSSASDRVPLSLVRRMLKSCPDLLDAILACRSNDAQLPDGRIVKDLRKFASMGSALCFPIESMYFFTVILCALLENKNLPVTLTSIRKVARSVYVYGDDLIVPVNQVEAVMETLTKFYCRVNTTKSFWRGNFRESCGMDAYNGECVTPTYLRRMGPHNRAMVQEVVSWVATSNLFYQRGYWATASYMKNRVESVVGWLPIIKEDSPGLGWLSFQNYVSVGRWNKFLHRFENKTYIVTPVYQPDKLEGWPALLKCLLRLKSSENCTMIDSKHLERSPRRGTSSMKRRWTTPY